MVKKLVTVVLAVIVAVVAFVLGVGIPMVFAGALCTSLGVQTLGFWQVFWIQFLAGAVGAAFNRNIVRELAKGLKDAVS